MMRLKPALLSTEFIASRAVRPLPSMKGCTSLTTNIVISARATGVRQRLDTFERLTQGAGH